MKSCLNCTKKNNCAAWQSTLNSFQGIEVEQKENLSTMVSEKCDKYKKLKLAISYPESCFECPFFRSQWSEQRSDWIFSHCEKSDKDIDDTKIGILQDWCELQDYFEEEKVEVAK